MDREYDLFERMSDGSLKWRGLARGLEETQVKLQKLAKETTNECLAVYTPDSNVVARLN